MVAEHDFLAFAGEVMGVPAERLSLDTAYGSIPEWDSVMQVRLAMEVDAKYGADIPVDAVADIGTLGGFYAYAKGGAKG